MSSAKRKEKVTTNRTLKNSRKLRKSRKPAKKSPKLCLVGQNPKRSPAIIEMKGLTPFALKESTS